MAERLADHHAIADAEALIDEMLGQLAGEGRDLAIECVAAPGARPAQTLLGAARSAELLVLGARVDGDTDTVDGDTDGVDGDTDGVDGDTDGAVGSLSQQVTRNARCPVVIIPGGRPAGP